MPRLCEAESCASHLGRIVQILSTWATEQHLAEGQVNVLAIRRPAWDAMPGDPADQAESDDPGLLVGTILVPTDRPQTSAPR